MYLPRTDEQRLLADSVTRRLSQGRVPDGREMATLGWIAAAFSEAEGGLGGRAADIAPICEAIGLAVADLPYVEQVLWPAAQWRAAGAGPEHAARMAALLAGELGQIVISRREPGAAPDGMADFATAGALAESIGLMESLLTAARAWLGTRRQFGRPLAANQVLQHRLADMFIALEESRSMLNLALFVCDAPASAERRPALHAAKAHIAHCARAVGQQAVHLHGAMGLTEELPVGRAYRRIEQLNAMFGNADHHTWAYAHTAPEKPA